MAALFPDQNNTNYPQSLKAYFNNLKYPDNEFLMYHQYIVKQYLHDNITQRGILLMHQVGSGKSILAVSIIEMYKKLDPTRKIVVLVSKSLVNNFKKNIIRYLNEHDELPKQDDQDELPDHDHSKHELPEQDELPPSSQDERFADYKFVSLNASNMYLQLYKAHKTKEELEYEQNLKNFTELVSQGEFLENSLLVVDEAHNLFNSISNGSKNAITLYDTIMGTKNLKIIFLSGTPIVNHPFELVPCFNMIKGMIPIAPKKSQMTTLFPENKGDFDEFFIDYKNLKIKNADRFQNRIVGLASYYGDKYVEGIREGFPEQLPTKLEVVNMSNHQYTAYNIVRDFEKDENPVGRKHEAARFSQKSDITSTYRIKSRQVSNYAIPDYALGPTRGKKSRKKFIEKISKEDIQNLEKYSPKMLKIIENIDKFPNSTGVVYSEFVSGEGLAVFQRVLEDREGYAEWQNIHETNGGLDIYDIKIQTGKQSYAVISGETPQELREKIINVFNSDENTMGQLIKLLLISRAGAEGLDLKNARHIHIMEPFWNSARIEQVIARVIRYKSHEKLPKDKQNVQPFVYLSDYPKDIDPLIAKEELTTDIDIYTKANQNKIIILDAINNIIEASVDCHAHYKTLNDKLKKTIKCKLCAPNNIQLYHPVLSKDLNVPNPCSYPKEDTIMAKEIKLDNGEKYYYSEDDGPIPLITIYSYQPSIDGYVQMARNHPYYAILMRKILEINNIL